MYPSEQALAQGGARKNNMDVLMVLNRKYFPNIAIPTSYHDKPVEVPAVGCFLWRGFSKLEEAIQDFTTFEA